MADSLPDMKRSWDNLMWNLEIDDDDYESEKRMKAAMDGVLASLVEVTQKKKKTFPLFWAFFVCCLAVGVCLSISLA